jgi:2-amino-4-hydroxy-6-hydroxymethyldihydropteridine diphosphokinase
MNKVYLSLGSNEGHRQQWLELAIAAIADRCGSITKQSSIYETAAWGIEDQPGFLNMALEVDTELGPEAVLGVIQQIELELGRQRVVKWGQRTLDIDILLYNHEIIRDAHLSIPHPYLHERRFTLEPLSEIAGDYVHPILNKSISVLLEECADPLEARRQ